MHITFIFPDWTAPEPWGEKNKQQFGVGHFNFAIAILSASLKSCGHTTDLIHVCFEPLEKDFKNRLQKYHSQTDLFAFSFTEVDCKWVKMMNRWIKEELGAFTIGGGIYPTLAPEQSLRELGLDMVCIGEGEDALSRVCDLLDKGSLPKDVINIWFMQNNQILKNPTGEFSKDIDHLPRLDDSIFDPRRMKNLASNLPRLFYLCGRNCPYGCAFCSNHAKRNAYRAGKHFVRRHSPDRVIEDLLYLRSKYPQIKLIHFADECIHYDKEWFRELMDLYQQKIYLPWRSYAMLALLDQETIDIMKHSGCTRVNVGIEAGTLRIRKLYNRPHMSDEKIVERVEMLKRAGIDVHSSTLLNAPTETIEEMLETIKLAAHVGTDIAVCGIVVPYQGTRLKHIAKKNGLLLEIKYENTDLSISPTNCTKDQVLFIYHAYRFILEIYKFLFHHTRMEKLIPLFDSFICSPFIPHKLCVHIHKRYLFGYLLNRAYRRVEKKLGRNEVKYTDSIRF
jgi:anaerobic magnesium-protoporphyrin IX monomethyl ester cyclase